MPGFIDRIRNRLRPQPFQPQPTAPVQPTRPLPQPSPPAGTPSRVQMPASPNSQPLNLPASAQPRVPSVDLSLSDPRQPPENPRGNVGLSNPVTTGNIIQGAIGMLVPETVKDIANTGKPTALGVGLDALSVIPLGNMGGRLFQKSANELKDLGIITSKEGFFKATTPEGQKLLAEDIAIGMKELEVEDAIKATARSSKLFTEHATSFKQVIANNKEKATSILKQLDDIAKLRASSAVELTAVREKAKIEGAKRMSLMFGKAGREAVEKASGSIGRSFEAIWRANKGKIALAGAGFTLGTILVGISQMARWNAQDDVINSAAIRAAGVRKLVLENKMNPDRALEMIENNEKAINFAIAVLYETSWSSFNHAERDMVYTNAAAQLESINNDIQVIKDYRTQKEAAGEELSPYQSGRSYMEGIADAKAIARELELEQRVEDEKHTDDRRKARLKELDDDTEALAAFWVDYHLKQREIELKYRAEDAAYYKLVEEERQKKRDEQMPSKLGFGLL